MCDALLLDHDSRSDTYPYIEVDEDNVSIEHEASVSKIGEEQLFYLESRGLPREEAEKLIIQGFLLPVLARITNAEMRKSFVQSIGVEE